MPYDRTSSFKTPSPPRSLASLKAVGGTVLEMNWGLSEDDFSVITIHRTGDCRNRKMYGQRSSFTVSAFKLPVTTGESSLTEQSLAPKNRCATKLMSRLALLKTVISVKVLPCPQRGMPSIGTGFRDFT